MKVWIVFYLLILLVFSVVVNFLTLYRIIYFKLEIVTIGVYCLCFGMLGGIVHCLRSVYLHKAVLTDWDSKWNLWYFIRPIISGIAGVISMVFIKAGLLVFVAGAKIESRTIVYIAIAFLAGYNVKKFLSKIEDISKAGLGMEKKEL